MAIKPIPIDVDLWGPKEIGAFLKVGPRQVTERYACLPDFPKAFRLPSPGSKGHQRWKASEVVAWANELRETA